MAYLTPLSRRRESGCEPLYETPALPSQYRIVVNLAPADLKKAGPAYDLPIAVGILLSSEQVYAGVSQIIFLGELSLDGSLRHTNGILPMVALDQQEGLFTVIVPDADAREASLIKGIKIIPITSLSQLVSYLRGEIPAPECKPDEVDDYIAPPPLTTDLAYIKG